MRAAPELALFERRLCRRNRSSGEVSEGATQAPSDGTLQMGRFQQPAAAR
jgi:hypothetical protein